MFTKSPIVSFPNPKFAAELLEPVNAQLLKEKEQLINGYLASVTDLVKIPAVPRATETALPEEEAEPIKVEKPPEAESSFLNNINAILPNQVNQNPNPNLAMAGQSIFGADDTVFGGIMNTNTARQRVA